ncbi:MAG TPA: glycosyltransferase family 4 protein [Planctomycetota bacterium]|nr:glycosyltransferase family 4 protein [Planctomycetota bacterium]
MNLLMISGDRQIVIGEKGPFYSMQREFSRYFDRIDVIVPKPSGPVRVSSIHGNVFFHPSDRPSRGLGKFVRSKGAELLATHGHGLVVSHDFGRFAGGRAAAALAKKFSIPHVSELHHIAGEPVCESFAERVERFLARRYVAWAKDRVTAFRVVNDGPMPRLLRAWGVPPTKIAVLPSQYLDFEVFRPEGGSLDERFDVIFVGRMAAGKGVGRMLDALELCESHGFSFRTLFVGKGPMRAGWMARAEQASLATRWIEWVDAPEDLARLYRSSRLVLCASTCEGGPRFTVEAMACGVPCVSTPVGIMEELLQDGEAGRLCGFDVPSLSLALETVLCDEPARRAMALAAVEKVQPFAYARAIGKYANGLRRMAGAPERTL